MIKNIRIKHFRSCSDTELVDLDHFVVLAGRNGAGKSSILKAIEWLARIVATPNPINALREPERGFPSFEVTFVFNERRFEYKFSGEVVPRKTSKRSPDLISQDISLKESLVLLEKRKRHTIMNREGAIASLSNGAQISLTPNVPSLPALAALLTDDVSEKSSIIDVHKFFSNIKYYPFDESNSTSGRPLYSETEYTKWKSEGAQTLPYAEDSPTPFRILSMYLDRKELFAEFSSLLGMNGLGLIDEISVTQFDVPSRDSRESKPTRYYFANFRPINNGEIHPSTFDYDDLSLGTRRILSILSTLLMENSTVFLIEHPEDGIHPGLTRKLVGLMRRYSDSSQIILTSHSMVIFNSLSPEDIRLVGMSKGVTKVRSLTEREVTAALKYINEDGPFSDVLETLDYE